MQVSIKSNINEFSRHMTWLEKKQIPFATSQAINDVAFEAQRAAKKGMDRHLDNPTPWTKSGVRVKRGKKSDPTASVYLVGAAGLPGNGDRNKYIEFQVEGGIRRPSKRYIAAPSRGRRKNKYGNVPNKVGDIQKMIGDKQRYFVGTPKGQADNPGIWKRIGTSKRSSGARIQKMYSFIDRAVYSKKYPFYKIVGGVVNNQFNKHFRNRLQAALRTAR